MNYQVQVFYNNNHDSPLTVTKGYGCLYDLTTKQVDNKISLDLSNIEAANNCSSSTSNDSGLSILSNDLSICTEPTVINSSISNNNQVTNYMPLSKNESILKHLPDESIFEDMPFLNDESIPSLRNESISKNLPSLNDEYIFKDVHTNNDMNRGPLLGVDPILNAIPSLTAQPFLCEKTLNTEPMLHDMPLLNSEFISNDIPSFLTADPNLNAVLTSNEELIFSNLHTTKENLSTNLFTSDDDSFNLCPLTVKCLQPVRELKLSCERLGLKFCTVNSSLNPDALKYNYFIQKCSVEGLYPFEELGDVCRKLNLKFNNGNVGMTKRIVDIIVGHRRFKNGRVFYLVKWKRQPMKRNSWISENFLLPKYKHLVTYYENLNWFTAEINQETINHFYHDLVNRKPYDYLTLIKVCALLFNSSESFVHNLAFSFSELKAKCKAILKIPISKLKKSQSELLEIMQFAEQRKRVLINLNEWEKDINHFNPATYIEVENNVDLEMAPTNFQFIHDYVRNKEVVEDPICFCNCDNCYDNKKFCCPHDSDGDFPYTKHQRLQLLPGYPIYECNKKCKCSDDCINRVVQHGQKVRVTIFRTSNGCGWGLKTLEVIQKDQFVLEYLGEIITSEEAEARGEIYDFIGRTYLFDLDYGEGNCLYTVDAGHMGNAGHFINHSCDPNLHVFAVWINNPDPNLPRLALFAKRKINRGEELTFDYKMVKNRDGFNVSNSPPVGVECKCNSKNCRKYLF